MLDDIFMMTWITTQWLALTSPVLFVLIGLALTAYYREPLPRRRVFWGRWASIAPALPLLAIVSLAGIFVSSRLAPAREIPMPARIVLALYLSLVGFTGFATWRARRRWTATAIMAVWLWAGAVVTFIAHWAITTGGSLGAL